MVATASRQNKSQAALFSKNDAQSGFFIALSFAAGIMFIDHHFQYFNTLRSAFSLAVAPLQYAVDYPSRITTWVQALVGSKKALLDENVRIRYEQTVLEAKMQNVLALQKENSQLKELLMTATKSNMQAMAAQILAVDTTTARQILILNKGSRDGVYIGQPVLDAKGVMGQVIEVGYMTSTVLLISDAKCAVPVRNNRTGERGLLTGINKIDQLILVNLPKTSSIQTGDMLVTSGLDRRYPEGFPVGRVEKINNIPGETFVNVQVSPVASLNHSRMVLLIWPDKEERMLTMQINERLKAVEALG